jgi:hypothetical protein
LNDTPEQAAFRTRVRTWLQDHKAEAPAASGDSGDTAWIDSRRVWQDKLAEAGLAGLTWPKEFGGQGLGPIEQVIVNQEIAAGHVPGILDVIGIGMLGPCIIAHGTDEQKSRYLGPMLHGDEVWCQLFSEPAAGSDLAAVQTRAVENPTAPSRSRARRSGRRTRSSRLRAAPGAHLAGQAQAQGPDDVHRPDGRRRRHDPRPAPDLGRGEFNEVFFDDSSCRPRTSSAASTTAGAPP